MSNESEDICSLCGKPGADKIPHPCHWPGECKPDSEYVHAECESEECRRAHEEFCRGKSDAQIREFVLANY